MPSRGLVGGGIPALLVAACLGAGPARGDGDWRTCAVEGWRADLERLLELIEDEHPAPHHAVSAEELRGFFARLDGGLEELSAEERACAVVEAVALLGEVHSGVLWSSLALRGAPVRFQRHGEGLLMVAAPEEHAALLGARFAGMGEHGADAVLAECARLFPEEAPGGAVRFAHTVLHVPELLRGLGLVSGAGPVAYAVEDASGARHTLRVGAGGPMVHVLERDGAGERLPPSLRRRAPYWFAPLEDDPTTLYFQYNQVLDDPDGEPLEAFFARLLATLREGDFARLVIDARQNGGGTSHLSRPLIEGLPGLDVDAPGRLFVLLGPGTGSAAAQLVFALEKRTHAIFVGEPSGQGPIFYSDPRTTRLPHTGIAVRLSTTRWVMSHPDDERPLLEPDLPAPLTLAALLAGRDPALEAALDFDPDEAPALLARVRERQAPESPVPYYGTVPPIRLRPGR